MTTDRPQVLLHDVHLSGTVDPAPLLTTIEQAVQQSLASTPAQDATDISEVIRAAIAREAER